MRHEWETLDPEDPLFLAVHDEGPVPPYLLFRYGDGPWRVSDGDPVSYAREILRLAARIRELEKPFEIFLDDRPGVLTAPEVAAWCNREIDAMAGRFTEQMRTLEEENAQLRHACPDVATADANRNLLEENRRLREALAGKAHHP